VNGLQFVDSMVGHLIWPIVVLIIVLAIRRHLGSLAERILELSFGGATVKFGQLISKGTEIIEESAQPPSVVEIEKPELPLSLPRTEPKKPYLNSLAADFDAFMHAASSPGLAVRSVFNALDEVERLLDQLGDQINVKARGVTLMDALRRRGYVTKELVDLFKSLRTARNAIAHGQADMPNEAESFEFVRQAAFLDAGLRIALGAMKAEKDKS
jgi:hypothetical protein